MTTVADVSMLLRRRRSSRRYPIAPKCALLLRATLSRDYLCLLFNEYGQLRYVYLCRLIINQRVC